MVHHPACHLQAQSTGTAHDQVGGIRCKRDGGRRLIIEITIGLQGELDEISMSDALFAAPNANDIGCTEGVVDAVGFQ